ncbi:MAG: hypothetical protein ABJA83_05245 [Burkholderiaceae bacterium]
MTETAASPPARGIVDGQHPMLAGHFPGHPIVPGAWLLAWIVAAATRRLAGAATVGAVKRVKFLRPLPPDQSFDCALDVRARTESGDGSCDTMRFVVTSAGATIAEGSLQLRRQ